MAYVPPSKRLGFVIKPEDKPPWTAFRPKATTHDEDSLSHLVPIFNASQVGTFNVFTHRSPLTVPLGPEDNDQPRPSDSLPYHAPHPLGHLIANIMIFERGQPLWESGAELWSHTVSEIMVDDWKAGKLNFDRPIPVFYGTSTRLDRFEFRGWWKMTALREVESESPELIDLLETKERFRGFPGAGRTKSKWQGSMKEKWIKTRFTPVEESFERYSELVDPTTLGPGEGAKLVLSVGGLEEELKVLERLQVSNHSEVEGEGRRVKSRGNL